MQNIELNIHLPFSQLLEAVKKLSPQEKLLLNDALWDEKMEVPQEQQDLVRARMKMALENPDDMLDWEEASKTLIS